MTQSQVDNFKPVLFSAHCQSFNELVSFYFGKESFYKIMCRKRMTEIVELAIKSGKLSETALRTVKKFKNEQTN